MQRLGGPVPSAAVEYQALYRKHRPQSFEDVIGQGHITSTLSREVSEGRVAHAYLFAGPRGTGKTTTARILAKALNCSNRNPDGSPCNACESCVAITEGASLDVLELDAASHNSVEDIRDMRVSVSTVATSESARRIFILDEAHMLSKAAGNALLKTLEEPPDHVHFVLATTEPYKLLDTIRSRAQRFDFHAVSAETLAAHLSRIADLEGYRTEPSALVAVARHALGSVRDSLSLLEQVAALGDGAVDLTGVSRALGLADAEAFAVLVDAVASRDSQQALELVARLSSQGVDLRRFAAEGVGFFRGVFLAHYAPNLAAAADEPEEILSTWRNAAKRIPASEVLRAVDILGEALIKLREGREERLMLELALIKLTRPEISTDPAALLTRVERLERRSAAAPGEPPDASSARPQATREAPPVPPPAPAPASAPPLPPPPPARPSGSEGVEVPGGTVVPTSVAPPTGGTSPDTAPGGDEAAGGPNVTIEQFQTMWPGLFGGLREVLGARRWALFRETEPGAVEGNRLVVHVRHDFHLEALRTDPVVAAVVATRAGDLLGTTVSVEFRAPGAARVGSAEDAEDPAAVELEKDRLFEAPADLTDPFRLVTDELGGVVIEEYEEGDE